MREELLSPNKEPIESEIEVGLRPKGLAEFVGQNELKGHLRAVSYTHLTLPTKA